jgi:hypothetical protein
MLCRNLEKFERMAPARALIPTFSPGGRRGAKGSLDAESMVSTEHIEHLTQTSS